MDQGEGQHNERERSRSREREPAPHYSEGGDHKNHDQDGADRGGGGTWGDRDDAPLQNSRERESSSYNDLNMASSANLYVTNLSFKVLILLCI
mmetsp:Transcript_18159/g.18216  ORF Transcript_18159/g.18216 Transcript_18159/m.18216 type:complete len:93 (+) Transcript_18159:73-351(+)